MTLTPMSRPRSRLLAQYLLACPGCSKLAAAHVDTAASAAVLVRFVCPEGCAIDDATILADLVEGRPA